jgi:hypothetical protein
MKGALKTNKTPERVMTFRKTAMTRKNFQNRVEGFLIGAMGWHCMAEVAAANGYPDHIQKWRGEVSLSVVSRRRPCLINGEQ